MAPGGGGEGLGHLWLVVYVNICVLKDRGTSGVLVLGGCVGERGREGERGEGVRGEAWVTCMCVRDGGRGKGVMGDGGREKVRERRRSRW